ncbi:MAG: thioredoxin domain-containing protein, partial [Streptosporangiales bacterium]
MANRLSDATSPYLLQHKDNPVDWWPWCDEAFAEARRRDVPVLLSVGYAACHWCHVMAHESFEDDETAAVMNARFVPIKVDREERPDVDAVYMDATQAMTGRGGWPMTCFLTPEGEPFYCGTYFPREQFHALLDAVERTWREQRSEIVEQGAKVVRAIGGRDIAALSAPVDTERLDAAVAVFGRDYDQARGGFGGAPKFPPAMPLEFLLRAHVRGGSADALRMVEGTCEAMARGGMADQLGGGFARYSVDADWIVPHFEKMLYDNALLLRVYLHWWRLTGSALARRVAEDTADFLLRDMRTPEGGFASALDADTGGVEGATYVWTPAQLREVLGDADGGWAADLFGVTDAGTFEHGTSTLQLRADPDDADRWAAVRARLFAARQERPQPGSDDKVVAAWNGLAIAALAEAGALLHRDEYVAAAEGAASLLRRVHLADRRLVRTSRAGAAGDNAGVLEDYGDVAEGLLALYGVTGDGTYAATAGDLLDTALERFADGRGGFYDTADDGQQLVVRPQDPTDNVTPSGQSAVAGVLLSYGALTGSARHREAAMAALGVYAGLADRAPRAAGWG